MAIIISHSPLAIIEGEVFLSLIDRYSNLKKIIKKYDSAVVAFSGGVDSGFLEKITYNLLKDKAYAVTVDAAVFPKDEINDAKRIAKEIGIAHTIISVDDLMDAIADNPPDRCYYCKKKIFSTIKNKTKSSVIFDGTNADDVNEHRPGKKALKELDIVSPLKEAGFTKKDIRELAKDIGLSIWNKNSYTCLATRVSYDQKISKDALDMIKKAEKYLARLKFKDLRVRHHGNLARIEVTPSQRDKLFDKKLMDKIYKNLKDIGYKYVTMDLKGYRTGSMDEDVDS